MIRMHWEREAFSVFGRSRLEEAHLFSDGNHSLLTSAPTRFKGKVVPSALRQNPVSTTSLLVFLLTLASAVAAEPTRAQLDFFENKIRPILADNCYKCHSPARGKIKGGLELDWKGGWEKGGDSGPVIVPGDPGKSLLIKAVRYSDPDLQMPPKGDKLSETQV